MRQSGVPPSPARINIWGDACVVADDPALLERLRPRNYKSLPE
jgi:hypothetical protein